MSKPEEYVQRLDMYVVERDMGDMPKDKEEEYLQELDRLWYALTEEEVQQTEALLKKKPKSDMPKTVEVALELGTNKLPRIQES